MNWKAIARFAKGTSHQKQKMPCQDYGNYKIINNAVIGAVADGAGSAKYAHIGAKLAVKTVLETITEQDISTVTELSGSDSVSETENQPKRSGKLCSSQKTTDQNGAGSVAIHQPQSSSNQEVREIFTKTVKKVRTALEERAAGSILFWLIYSDFFRLTVESGSYSLMRYAFSKMGCSQAESDGYSIDDLACTLLIVVATPDGVAAMQIGDGFITVRYQDEEEPQLLFPPDKGEYINETTFVTSANASEAMQVVVETRHPEFICASTDGLERLAIRMSDWTPFAPFFRSLEKWLQATDKEKLKKDLEDFLNSETPNARTDDDKTLFLCLYDNASDSR